MDWAGSHQVVDALRLAQVHDFAQFAYFHHELPVSFHEIATIEMFD